MHAGCIHGRSNILVAGLSLYLYLSIYIYTHGNAILHPRYSTPQAKIDPKKYWVLLNRVQYQSVLSTVPRNTE
jgi:hypothetical protein